MDDKIYWHALNMVPGLGPQTYNRLLTYFETPEQVWNADPAVLYDFFKKKVSLVDQLIAWKKQFNLDESFKKLRKYNISIITIQDEEYPDKLKNIYACPPLLYYQGNIASLKSKSLAIVGSRKATIYGQQIAEKIAFDLAKAGFAIVSGMARGIDSCAHWGAIKAQGETVAVLGCGIDIVYPPENKKLFDRIRLNGAIVSEFPPETPPEAKNFPRRNRIISGLSDGVIVVEAAQKSGSLITAELALQQGRDVFAVPGSIFNTYSKGTNCLIQQGAKLVQNANDILEEYGISMTSKVEPRGKVELSPIQKSIIQFISAEPITLEEIIKKTGLKAELVISQLTVLEIKGIIKQLPGKRYIYTF